MMTSLNDHQKEMLIFGIKDSINFLERNGREAEKEQLIEALSQDEAILSQMEEILNHVCKKLQTDFGESYI